MQCLNVKNKKVAALLKEYTDILGSEDAAYYVLSENNGFGLDKAPNGEPSKLFSDLLQYYKGDNTLAIQSKAKTYSENFKEWFGESKVVDHNGEPLVVYHGSNNDIAAFEKTKLGENTGKGIYIDANTGETIEVDSNNAFFASSDKIVSANYAFIANEQDIAHFANLFEDLYTVITEGNANNGTIKNREDANSAFKQIGVKFPELKYLTDQIPSKGKMSDELQSELENKLQEYASNLKQNTKKYSARQFTNSYYYYKKLIKGLTKFINNDKYLERFKANDKTVLEEGQDSMSFSVGYDSQIIHYDNDTKRFKYTWSNGKTGYLDSLSISQLKELFKRLLKFVRTGMKNTNQELIDSGYDKNTHVGYYYVSIKNPLVHDYNGSSFPDNYVNQRGEKTQHPTGYIAGRQVKKAIKDGNDGVVYKNIKDPLASDSFGFFEPSQIKSVDNKGSFSNSDNNIYNQKATAKETPTGRNKKLQKILRTLYPQINLSMFSDPHLRGQAILRGNQAGEVLINAALENQDTLPHEYAHHYIAWFRKSPIVQKAIKMFGTEEQLVQAIGENSVKAVNWYNKIWNEIKGLFSKKQATLNKLTKDFLAGKQYTDATEILEETHYQTIDSAKDKSTVKAMDATYAKLMEALSRRIKDIQYAKPLNSRKIEELRSLEFRLNQMENDKATFEFVSYMNRDVIEALDQITIILDKVREAQKYGKLHDISAAELDLIKKGYIGFYGNIASNIQNMLDDESTFNYINDPELIQTVREQLRITVGNYNEIVRKYNNASDIIAKENFINEATKAGSFTVDELKRILDEGDSDINVWDQWVGSSQYSNSEMIRLMMNKIINIKNKVNELELTRGKEILDLLDKTDRAKVALFHERNKDGKKTGFITRDLNYGQHYQDYLAHQRKLADDLGFGEEDLEAVPSLLNSEQLKTWNKRNNEWEAKHTIRKFKPEYYELTNSLSEETRNFRDEINMEISLILSKTLDENHETHREDLNEMEYKKLEALETRRRNLANPFNLDGTRKVDLYLRVAKEMAIYNKTLREKLEYKTNFEKFNKARNKAKTTLSAEKYKLWIERNTVDKITEKFWEDIKSLSSNNKKSEDQVRWEEARKNMLRLYTNEKGEVDVENMSTAVKGYILAYDEMISDEAIANRDKSKKSGIMNIAEWAVNDAFYVEMERAEAEGEAAFNTWLSYNGRYNSRGEVIPASFWRRLVPKQELRNKYIERIPNRTWSEIDRESPFYDHRFSQYENRGESRIPNPNLYDNSTAYNKIISDTNLKNLYDKLVQTYEDSNNKINILKRGNKFKLAQIEGGAMTRIQSQDNVLNGLQTAFKDVYTIKEDDTRYMTENAKRADGSLVKLIPTRYIKMLSDPNMLTNDIVGSTIAYYKMATNYELMSEAAPELEMAMDFVGRMEFKGKKGGKISGVESRTYDKFKFLMDKFVYGMERDAVEVDVPLPNGQVAKVSVDKVIGNLAAYTRIQGISQNINVILTGLITNKFQNRLEAISGIYFGNAELAKATKVILPSYASALANIGKSNNKDKALCYLEFLGMLRENEQTFGKLNQSRFLRTINQHYWYFGHELTDYVTKGKMALAVAFYNKYNPELGKFQNKNEFLRTYKNKKQGKAAWEALEVSFYDIFEVQNNQLVIKDEFKDIVDDRTINRIRNTSKQIGTRIDTQLTDMDKAKIHSNVLGQLLLIYRNFLLVNLDTKFLTKRQFNYTTGMWSEAQWPAAIKYLRRHFAKDKEKQIRQLQELYKENYESLDDFEKGCLKRISYELLFSIVGFFLVNSLLRAILDEDKDNWWKQEAAYISMRSALESRSNIIPVEAINLFQSPTAAWSTLESIGGLLNVFDFEEIRRGPYKGMTRSQRSLIKITPLRSLYEARDPKSKMEFYENMVSIFPDKPELFSWALK